MDIPNKVIDAAGAGGGTSTSFYTQVKSLTWKNYILKRRNMVMVYVDIGLQIVMFLCYLANFGILTKKDSTMDKYFTGTDFYTFVFYLSVVVGNYISLCIFVNF
jgi:hypothetical protein